MPTALPTALTSFVGRERELVDAVALLRRPGARLLTLTGPGGVGKSRLALTIAETMTADDPDGATFVDLTTVRDPTLVMPTIARRFGLRESAGHALVDQLIAVSAGRPRLLVLDNVEHVIAAAPTLGRLLDGSRGLTILATSRVPLRLDGEQEFPLSPLDDAASVTLFVERARAVNPRFVAPEADSKTVVTICRRLDGLPLAIELAAARVKMLSPHAILGRLDHRLELLTGGMRDAAPRLRSMREAIAWSYDLLTPDEQVLFRRLAVFAGGFSLEAAEAVCGPPGTGDRGQGTNETAVPVPCPLSPVPSVLDGLGALVDHSLLRQVSDEEGETRLTMLETVRDYARERLAEHADDAIVRERHARWFIALAEEAAPQITSPEQGTWLRRLDDDYANLRAAHQWLIAHRPVEALNLAAVLWLYWMSRGFLGDGRTWLDQALTAAGDGEPTTASAQARLAAGALAHYHGDDRQAVPLLERSLAEWRALDDPWGSVATLIQLGTAAVDAGDYDLATGYLDESRKLCEAARARTTPILLAVFGGHAAIAAGWTLYHRGIAAWGQGRVEAAVADLEAALAWYRPCHHLWGMSDTLGYLALIACEAGDLARAATILRETLVVRSALGTSENLPTSLADIATLAVASGQPQTAARLFGAVAALQETFGTPPMLPERLTYDRATAATRAALGEERFAAEWAAGRALSAEAALALARTSLDRATTAPEATTLDETASRERASAGLTVRELAVLRLLAAGSSNAEIAAELGIAVVTIKTHVANILAKLGVPTRSAAAAYAHRHGIV